MKLKEYIKNFKYTDISKQTSIICPEFITDIDGIQDYVSLTEFVSKNTNITDFSLLPESLVSLEITCGKFESLMELPALPNLVTLDVSRGMLKSLDGIQKFPKLKNIYFSYCEVSELKNLPHNLIVLSCAKNKFSDISELYNLTKLELLVIINDHISYTELRNFSKERPDVCINIHSPDELERWLKKKIFNQKISKLV